MRWIPFPNDFFSNIRIFPLTRFHQSFPSTLLLPGKVSRVSRISREARSMLKMGKPSDFFSMLLAPAQKNKGNQLWQKCKERSKKRGVSIISEAACPRRPSFLSAWIAPIPHLSKVVVWIPSYCAQYLSHTLQYSHGNCSTVFSEARWQFCTEQYLAALQFSI